MNLIFNTDLNLFSVVNSFLFMLFGLGFGYAEFTGKFQLSYSKFNSAGQFDSKKGMFFIYFIPLLTYLYCYASYNFNPGVYHRLVLFAVLFHFAKRCFEVLFLHKYSGKMSFYTVLLITFGYSSAAYMIHESVNKMTSQNSLQENSILLSSVLGLALFTAGQAGNLYHHILLRNLRSGEGKEYKIPAGGLFRYVNCPHYLSEITAWFGIAVLSKYLMIYSLAVFMASYLTARSLNTSRWYQEKIPDFPKERKSIIPFLI